MTSWKEITYCCSVRKLIKSEVVIWYFEIKIEKKKVKKQTFAILQVLYISVIVKFWFSLLAQLLTNSLSSEHHRWLMA